MCIGVVSALDLELEVIGEMGLGGNMSEKVRQVAEARFLVADSARKRSFIHREPLSGHSGDAQAGVNNSNQTVTDNKGSDTINRTRTQTAYIETDEVASPSQEQR